MIIVPRGRSFSIPKDSMRTLRLTLIGFAILIWGRPVQSQNDSAEASLRSRIAAHEKASAENDLRGLVDVYSLDAEMISGAGVIVRGRDAIEAYYQKQVASASARAGRHHTHPPEAIRLRFVTADVALIDLPSRNVGGQDAAGQPMAPSEIMLITVWRREAGAWLVVSQRALPASAAAR